jgi:hypothetical protein
MILAVTVGNETACDMYIKAGFTPFGVDPDILKSTTSILTSNG